MEFPDKLGPLWMNEDNLMLCINAYCKNKGGKIKAKDITNEIFCLRNGLGENDFPRQEDKLIPQER
jgi:hypothetical protein